MSRERYGSRDSRERSRERDDRYPREEAPAGGPLSGHTNSNDPKSLMSRVFIGNLPHEKVTRDEVMDMFSKHGHVSAVNILKGFGFVQFENEDQARKAVSSENGSVVKGQRLDVKMAAEGKKKKPAYEDNRGKTDYADNRGGGGADRVHERPYVRDRSPIRDRTPYDRARPGARDPYDDPYRGRPAPKDPYDTYRRDPYPDPYAATRDPYPLPPARDPYAAPAPRDPYPPAPARPAPERPPVDCEITVLDRTVREYADGIERRLKTHAILTFVNVLPSEDMLSKAQEDISKRSIPFNIVVSAQNQQHRSITVRILHGTPQEHRNMPLEDALKLVTSNFDLYLRNLRSGRMGAVPPIGKAGGSEDFTLPDTKTSYLLNLLADNRFLTLEELSKVLHYLTDRKEQLLLKQRLATVKMPETSNEEAALAQQQQELQAKILSVLGGGDQQATQATSALQQLSGYGDLNNASALLASTAAAQAQSNAAMMGASTAATNGTGYNLSTPGVQQALDNLISNSSGLLQNLSGGVSAAITSQAAQVPAVNSQAGAMYQGYGNYPGY